MNTSHRPLSCCALIILLGFFCEFADAQNPTYTLSLIPVSESNSRQFLILSENGQVIDTLAEVPTSRTLVDFIISSSTEVVYIFGDRILHVYHYLILKLESSGIWMPRRSISLGIDLARFSSVGPADPADFHPLSFELQDANTVLRKHKGEVEVMDLDAIAAAQRQIWNGSGK